MRGLMDKIKNLVIYDADKEFYAQRKSTVEPVFGIIKEVMGFRRFMLRGLVASRLDDCLVGL